MDYQFAKTYEGEAKHCCLMMDLALDEGYLHPTITLNFGADSSGFEVKPPHILGEKLSPRGRKHKPNLLVNFCPWCGAKLEASS